jgi:hypothetical protein
MLRDLKSQFENVRRLLERPISMKQGAVTLGLTEETRRIQARDDRRQRVKQMRRELFTLMEQHPGSRKVMSHLDLVERTLRSGGFQTVEALPIRVIAKALSQMEQLVVNWSPVGLAELRSRMAVMVKSRANEPSREEASTSTLELDLANAADVTEVDDADFDHAEFEEMQRSWAGRAPVGNLGNEAGKPAA